MKCIFCKEQSLKLKTGINQPICSSCSHIPHTTDNLSPVLETNSSLRGLRVLKSKRHSDESFSPSIKKKKFQKRQCFRLSEPFTYLLKQQLYAFLKTQPAGEYCECMQKCTWNLWTNYLSITGEFGPSMWALTFQNVVKAIKGLLKSREELIRAERKFEKHNDLQSTTNNQLFSGISILRNGAQVDLDSFQYLGWGQFYDPNMGPGNNEIYVNPLFNTFNESQDDDNISIDESLILNMDLPVLSKTKVKDFSLSSLCNDKWISQFYDCSADVKSLENCYENFIISKISPKYASEKLFWRARKYYYISQCRLMEYNIAIIFIASLCSSTARISLEDGQHKRDQLHPTCKLGILTLTALQNLCKNKEFPFLNAKELISESPFFFRDNYLFRMCERTKPPKINHLVRAAAHLMHMLAIRHRPLIPLAWLIHRYLTVLGFPRETHDIANHLIANFGRRVQTVVKLRPQGLLYLLPTLRYLRSETFAMAFVVIIARIAFKLDDDFEYRMSTVANFLDSNPHVHQLIQDQILGEHESLLKPFNWMKWASWVSLTFPGKAKDPAINYSTKYTELLLINSAAEFLKSDEADLFMYNNWRVRNQATSPGYSTETRIDLAASLSEIIPENNINSNYSPILSDTNVSNMASHPCKVCNYYSKKSIIDAQSFSACPETSFTSFQSIFIFKQHVDDRNAKLKSTLLQTKSSNKTLYRNWLKILRQTSSYAPISSLDFSMPKRNRLNTKLIPIPNIVYKMNEKHSQLLHEFLDDSLPSYLDNCEDGDPSSFRLDDSHISEVKLEPSSSLKWLLNVASSLCSTKLPGLLLEVNCIENLLYKQPDELIQPENTNLVNLAYFASFDYSVPFF